MSMQSIQLLQQLEELPTDRREGRRSFRDHLASLLSMDAAAHAAEVATGAAAGTWAILDQINVDDTLQAAYQAQYPGLAADHSLHDHWLQMQERGPEAMDGFINGLKGKMAEFNVQEQLTDAGWTNVTIAPDPTQGIWDISGINPEGIETFIQVKTGTAAYAGQVQDIIADNPDINFAVSSEIYHAISDSSPELLDNLADIGPDYLLVTDINDGLTTLSGNLGIDIPDGVTELIPYATAVIAGARLIHSVIQTEREFKAADRTTRNKIQVVQTLTVMSRMGVNTVLAAVGGMAGATAGSFIPGLGNLVGGVFGSIAGAGMGMYLNQHLQPHMLSLALDITGLEDDDLFYYKNKARIDQMALSMRGTAAQLASN